MHAPLRDLQHAVMHGVITSPTMCYQHLVFVNSADTARTHARRTCRHITRPSGFRGCIWDTSCSATASAAFKRRGPCRGLRGATECGDEHSHGIASYDPHGPSTVHQFTGSSVEDRRAVPVQFVHKAQAVRAPPKQSMIHSTVQFLDAAQNNWSWRFSAARRSETGYVEIKMEH